MNEKAAYELTIAEKLELLTVPDKVDAIWARIEAMLDIDMPTDDGPEDPPVNPPSGSGLWNITGIAIFIAALIATIYFTNKKPNINSNTINTPRDSATTIINQPASTNNKPPPAELIPQSPQRIMQDSSASLQSSLPLPAIMDSLSFKGSDEPSPLLLDSAFNNLPATPVVTPPVDTGKKKGRGVKGITDDDYRIVPDKDSTP
jgi:hypothetical protein